MGLRVVLRAALALDAAAMAGRMSNLPFLPCFSRRRCTCCSDSPRSSVTSKCLSASAGVCVYAFSMLFLAVTSGYVSRGVNSIRFDSIRFALCGVYSAVE